MNDIEKVIEELEYLNIGLEYTKEKHKNDKIGTFDTDISFMCYDIINHINEAIHTIRELKEQNKCLLEDNAELHDNIQSLNVFHQEALEKIPKWHFVADGDLPKEHDSIFAKFKGTDKWNNAMFEKISDDVIVAIKDENGRCVTTNAHTTDGKWKCDLLRAFLCYEVVAWTELPKFEEVE